MAGIDYKSLSDPDYLLSLYEQMIGDVDLPDVLRQVAEVVCKALDCDRGTIYFLLEDTRELESVVVTGNVSRVIKIPLNSGSLAGFCALSRRPFVVEDAYGDLSHISQDLEFDSSWDEKNGFRTRDVMCAPVIFGDRVMGVVQVMNSYADVFGEAALVPLERVTRLVAFALYHADIYSQLADFKIMEKEKAQFMRVLVHELKSPVAASKTLATGLQYAHQDNPQLTGALDKMSARLDELLQLISDILDLSRIKQGGALGDVTVLDLVEESRDLMARYNDMAVSKGLTMEVCLPEGPLPVRFDQKGYQLVLSNLVSNAVKYTDTGTVTVAFCAEDGNAVLSVSDSGIGIPEVDIPKLFNDFFRASNAVTSSRQGTGVGLSGAKNLLDRFGGSIELQSVENEGSTFSVRLPLHT